ncbi:MAG: hypothetical protein OXH38_11800 [Chloroflexi bacterium]|nr:hypothetical protein [Chloroflexota bacterium]
MSNRILSVVAAAVAVVVLGCSTVSAPAPPDFNLSIEPALTLADTKFTLTGTHTGGVPDYEDQNLRWAHAHYPAWGNHVGGTGALQPSVLVPSVQRSKARVILTPRALTHHVWDNSDSDVAVRFSTEISDTITTSSSIEWSTSATLGLSVGVEAGFGSDKVSESVDFSVTVGESHSESQSVEIGTKDAVEAEVPGGQIVLAILLVQQGTVEADLDLTWQVRGWTWIDFDVPCKDAPLVPDCKDWTRTHDGTTYTGHTGRLGAVDLQPTSGLGHYSATVSIGFAGESEIRTITIPDADPTTVDNAVERVLKEYGGQRFDLPPWDRYGNVLGDVPPPVITAAEIAECREHLREALPDWTAQEVEPLPAWVLYDEPYASGSTTVIGQAFWSNDTAGERDGCRLVADPVLAQCGWRTVLPTGPLSRDGQPVNDSWQCLLEALPVETEE